MTAALLLALVTLIVGAAAGAAVAWRLRAPAEEPPEADVDPGPSTEQLLLPVTDALRRVEQQLVESERHRALSHGALDAQVKLMNETSNLLRTEASSLVQALRAPQTRGRWGEMQLRRIVELAGMVDHCDFDEQVTIIGSERSQRPDLVVHIAGGKNIVVDAKVPFAAYLEYTNADDEGAATARLTAHARHLRTHIDQLSGREYWSALPTTPEFVVLFVPAEPFLSAALDHDPTLLEYAFDKQVVIATPNTLVALLRTVAYTWRQEALTENAQQVLATGRELHQRLGTMGGHLAKVGSCLEGSVKAYNQTVASLESRVLVTARKFADLQVVDTPVATPDLVDLAPRTPQAAELSDDLSQVAEIRPTEATG